MNQFDMPPFNTHLFRHICRKVLELECREDRYLNKVERLDITANNEKLNVLPDWNVTGRIYHTEVTLKAVKPMELDNGTSDYHIKIIYKQEFIDAGLEFKLRLGYS